MTTDYDVDGARANLPVLEHWTYLNTGTVGVMAEPVLRKHLDYIADHERFGHATQARAVEGYERARTVLAHLIGAASTDVALNRNATDGINWVAATFPLKAGDEIITSTEEHPAMIYPWLAACERSGARLRFIDLATSVDGLRAAIEQALSPSTRIVALSHVSCETGKRVPVEIVRDVVGDTVAILIDASQSVGQFPVDIPSLRATFAIGNGHKWLAGPKGTGFAWFDPATIDLVPPAYFGDGAVEPRWMRGYYQANPSPQLRYGGDATRFEYGTRAWHMYEALADAIEYQAGYGWGAIFSHVDRISTLTKATLEEIPGVNIVTPATWNESSGIVTFTIEGLVGEEISRELWETEHITQRRVEVPSAVRVSCTYFTSEEDVIRLGHAVDRIARGR